MANRTLIVLAAVLSVVSLAAALTTSNLSKGQLQERWDGLLGLGVGNIVGDLLKQLGQNLIDTIPVLGFVLGYLLIGLGYVLGFVLGLLL